MLDSGGARLLKACHGAWMIFRASLFRAHLVKASYGAYSLRHL